MKFFTVSLVILTVGLIAEVSGQSQVITPDNQAVSFQMINGTNNLFIGQSTSAVTGGAFNTFMGGFSGQSTVGTKNTFVGYETGKPNIDGNNNVFIGYGAGVGNQHGSRNLIVGSNAGFNGTDGDGNTVLGADAMIMGTALSNATAIGANARVMNSNSLVLGNNVNVGIGTSTPRSRLELASGTNGRSGLRLTDMTANSLASEVTTNKFLTVNDKGDVTLAERLSAMAMRVQPTTKKQWADYVFTPTYRLQPLAEVEQYIQEHKHLPGIPGADEMVKQGVDLTTLLATLVKKNEELTLHLIAQQKRIERLEQQNQRLRKKK